MKKITLTLTSAIVMLTSMAHAQITTSAPYCTGGYDDGTGFVVPHYISNVKLGTLDNTSGTTQFPSPHYAYYNTVASPNLVIGTAYPLSVMHDNGSIHYVVVYIDYNHNNNFNDPGERVMQVASSLPNPTTATITIPVGAVAGTTRMRVMVFEDEPYLFSGATNATPCTSDATGSFDWGETEDYNVTIVSSVPALPKAGFSSSAVTGNTSTVFTLTDTSKNTPTAWAWTFTPNNVAYQTGSTATSASPHIKFTLPGTYTVKQVVTNAAGKDSVTKANYITITSSTGVDEYPITGASAVYPNPATNNIRFDNRFTGSTMTISDLQGRTIARRQNVETSYSIADLPTGIYVIKLVSNNEVYTQKLEIVR